MSQQVQRIVRNGLSMEGSAGENGELLSLRDHEDCDDGVGGGGLGGGMDTSMSGGGGGGGSGYDGSGVGGGVGYSMDESGELIDRKKTRRSESFRRSDNCCEKTLKCMSVVPCGSLLSWIVQLLGIGCLTGGLLIATRRSRDLLDEDSFLWFMDYTLIGVSVGMFVLTTIFLVVGHLSSEPTSRRVFHSFAKNKCAKGLNIFLLIFTYIMTALWILATALLGTPLVFILNFLIVDRDSFNPAVFGFKSKEYKDNALDDFTKDTEKLLICYGVAMFGAFLIANSLIFFIMSISANIKHLQDNRFATLNAYDGEEVRNSKHSVVDTNM